MALVLIFLLYLVSLHSEAHSHRIHLRFKTNKKQNVRNLDPELYIMIVIIHLINMFYLPCFLYLFKMKTFILELKIKIQPLASRHLSSVLDI